MVTFSARNTNIYKIFKLRKAIFSVFYNISPPNSANLRMLFIAVVNDFVLFAKIECYIVYYAFSYCLFRYVYAWFPLEVKTHSPFADSIL